MVGELGERFDLVRRLGSGGFGIVYEAFDRKSSQRIALKTLTERDPTKLYMLKREFRALADVRHNNIVRLHEMIVAGDDVWLAMELVEGRDFLEWLWHRDVPPASAYDATAEAPAPAVISTIRATTPPRVDFARLRDGIAQLANGVAALHARKILHRDLKPSNVLVDRNNRVVLLDFGIVKELSAERTDTQHIVGTPEYMAPEQAAADHVGPAADWYALGVMLFEAVAGRRPYSGTPLEIIQQKQTREAPRLRDLSDEVPPDLDALCALLLAIDPKKRPDGAAILAQLGTTSSSELTEGKSAPFIGRERELQLLRESFENSRLQGRSVVARVHGASGMGKTALVRTFLGHIARDALILEGRCYEREAVPYKGVDAAIDALSRELLRFSAAEAAALRPRHAAALARIFPVLERVPAIRDAPKVGIEFADPQQVRLRAFAALRELLVRLSDRRRVVLFIDDMQWADPDGVALLGELTAPPDAPAFTLILAFRDEHTASPDFRELAKPDFDIELRALSPAESAELGRALIGDNSALAANLVEESGGSPFFIGELARHFDANPARAVARGVRLDDLVRSRVHGLSREARLVLELAAVAGRPVEPELLSSAAGFEARDSIATLRDKQLLRGTAAGAIACFHDRIREAVVAGLTADDLRSCHHQLARALLDAASDDAEGLVFHLEGAGDRDKALEYAIAAAYRAVEVLAFGRAAALLSDALNRVPADSPQRAELMILRAETLAACGRAADAAELYLTIPGDETTKLEMQRRAAQNFLYSGHVDRGFETLRAVLSQFGMRLPSSNVAALLTLIFLRLWLRVRGLGYRSTEEAAVAPTVLARIDVCQSIAEALGTVQTTKANVFQNRSLIHALNAGEPGRLARAMVMEGAFLGATGKTERALAVLQNAEALAASLQRTDIDTQIRVGRASVHIFAGRWSDAREGFDSALALPYDGRSKSRWIHDVAMYYGNCSLIQLGDLIELRKRFPAALREASDVGDLYLATNLRVGYTNIQWLIDDDVDGARSQVDEAMSRWSRHGFSVQHFYATHSLASADLYRGRPREALQRIDEAWPRAKRAMLFRVPFTATHALLIRASAAVAVSLDERGRMRREAELAVRRLRTASAWAMGAADALEAALLYADGRVDLARPLLRGAAARFDALGMKLHAACVRKRLGQLLGGDAGSVLSTDAKAWFDTHLVKDPARLADVFAPFAR
jgi:eukaryotic-like serine/threonine-protein kinase